MKPIMCVAGLVAALLVSWGAQAQDRYVEPPPVLVSPDLSAPWVTQLRRVPDRVRAQPRAEQARQYRSYQQARQRPAHSRPARQSRSSQYRPPQARQQRVERRAVRPQPQARQPVRTAATRPSDRAWQMNDPKWLPQVVDYRTEEAPGTIVVDTRKRFLYLVLEGGKARRYGVGVGKEGFGWSGTHTISQKREWPDWRPPAAMIAREKKKGRNLPSFVKGGPSNPLGARALYIGSTLYRIHGTNAPWTIGRAVSSGCIRMRNEDVIELYNRVPVGAKVVVS